MEKAFTKSNRSMEKTFQTITVLGILALIVIIIFSWKIISGLSGRLTELTHGFKKFSSGNFKERIKVTFTKATNDFFIIPSKLNMFFI